jgi:hypothetical protein
MKPDNEKKGETPGSYPGAPRTDEKLQVTRKIKLTPEGVNQTDVDAVLKRLALMRKRFREDILFVGGHLAKMRDTKIPYGGWTAFVERTFPLSVKTANIWIRAYENRDSELAVNDWDAYMRALYGNEPKKLKGKAYPNRNDSTRRNPRSKTRTLPSTAAKGSRPSSSPTKARPDSSALRILSECSTRTSSEVRIIHAKLSSIS